MDEKKIKTLLKEISRIRWSDKDRVICLEKLSYRLIECQKQVGKEIDGVMTRGDKKTEIKIRELEILQNMICSANEMVGQAQEVLETAEDLLILMLERQEIESQQS